MTRKELKEIILAVIDKMQTEVPQTACSIFFADQDWSPPCDGCDYTTYYGVGEEG